MSQMKAQVWDQHYGAIQAPELLLQKACLQRGANFYLAFLFPTLFPLPTTPENTLP